MTSILSRSSSALGTNSFHYLPIDPDDARAIAEMLSRDYEALSSAELAEEMQLQEAISYSQGLLTPPGAAQQQEENRKLNMLDHQNQADILFALKLMKDAAQFEADGEFPSFLPFPRPASAGGVDLRAAFPPSSRHGSRSRRLGGCSSCPGCSG